MSLQIANICRPGWSASCALCCGSHNYCGSHSDISALFARRAERVRDFSREYLVNHILASRSDMTGSYYHLPPDRGLMGDIPPLFPDLPRCAYVGTEGGLVRCLLAGDDGSRADCPLAYGGKHWTCPARDGLSDNEIGFAARLTRDWYYYGILINSPDYLRDFMENYARPEDVPGAAAGSLRERLALRACTERPLHSLHGYFG